MIKNKRSTKTTLLRKASMDLYTSLRIASRSTPTGLAWQQPRRVSAPEPLILRIKDRLGLGGVMWIHPKGMPQYRHQPLFRPIPKATPVPRALRSSYKYEHDLRYPIPWARLLYHCGRIRHVKRSSGSPAKEALLLISEIKNNPLK